jgi:hypothetical protein
VNALLAESLPADSDQPRTVEGLLEEARAQANANVSVDGLNSVAVFARTPDRPAVGGVQPAQGQEYAGAVVTASWEREAVLDDLRSAPSTDSFGEAGSYGGVTVYEVVNESVPGVGDSAATTQTTYLAEYEDGRWAFSTNRSVVEDVIDVADGDREAFGGDLRTAFDRTREDAYFRYAAALSETQRELIGVAAQQAGRDAPVDLSQFSAVTAYSGAYYTDEDSLGVATYLTAEDERAAERLDQTIGSLIGLGQSTVEPDTPAAEQLDALRTELDGRAVGVVYEIDSETVVDLIEDASTDTDAGAPVSLTPVLSPATGAAVTGG